MNAINRNMDSKEGNTKRRLFVCFLVAFVIFVAAIGVVWVNSLPTLNVSEGKISINNCEPPLPTYAIGVCPKLYCKKLVMESGNFPQSAQIGFAKAKPSADQVLHGSIRFTETGTSESTVKDFQCELRGYEVIALKYQ